jgi:hypothetical protein
MTTCEMTTCEMCSGKIIDNSYQKTLKCGHSFHSGCVYIMCANNHKCPSCLKREILISKLLTEFSL